jgi:hypothetical protein
MRENSKIKTAVSCVNTECNTYRCFIWSIVYLLNISFDQNLKTRSESGVDHDWKITTERFPRQICGSEQHNKSEKEQ